RAQGSRERVAPARRRLLEQRHVPLECVERLGELGEERMLGRRRRGAAVEEVPRHHADYDARVTRHFLTGQELTSDELDRLLDRAIELKRDRLASGALAGLSVALIFDKPSTRTRLSFEVGVHELGGYPVVLREGEMQIARGESARDTALVLSRFVHAVGIRTGPHALVEDLAAHSSVPVINMLTAEH